MRKRKLGENGPEITEIGFGAWAIGGAWEYGWGEVNDDVSIKAIHQALDSGINWIDTAAVYGLGHSEEVVGKALKGRRDEIFLATKCGLIWDSLGRLQRNLHPRSMRKEIEASLRRLKVDYIDLYQFHWPDKAHPVEKSWEEMVKFKEEGKIRYLGVSNFDVKMMQRCQKIYPIDSLQPPYSLLEREIEAEILPFCQENGIGVISYSPMQSGLLSGKFDISRLASDDWRRKSPSFWQPKLDNILDFVEELRTIVNSYQKTVGQLAIAWVLQQAGITSAIVGARNEQQVIENINGSGWDISDADVSKIEELLLDL